MSNSKNELINLLKSCIVKITVSQENRVVSTGTGFFVAPNLIMTCAHVVKKAHENNKLSINLHIEGQNHKASIEDGNFFENADVCLLHTDISGHSCVYLDEAMEVGDNLYAYGYPEKYPNGDSLTVEFEGNAAPSNGKTLAKLKGGQVQSGFSGAPLLNLKTGGVCGILKSTRDRNTDLGGRAVPIAEVFALIENVKEKQRAFHKDNKKWKKLASKLQKENKQDNAVTTFNEQKQKVKGVQYNVAGNVVNNDTSSEKSNKNLYLAIVGAVLLVIIVGIVAMVALKPTVSNVTSGDGATGVIHTGDGNVTITSPDKENE